MVVVKHQWLEDLLLPLEAAVNAAIVVLEEDQAQQVPPVHREGQETQEHPDHLDSLESLNKHLANKSQLWVEKSHWSLINNIFSHHANLALEANQASQDPPDHLASREAQDNLDNQEDKPLPENLDPQDPLDRLEHQVISF